MQVGVEGKFLDPPTAHRVVNGELHPLLQAGVLTRKRLKATAGKSRALDDIPESLKMGQKKKIRVFRLATILKD